MNRQNISKFFKYLLAGAGILAVAFLVIGGLWFATKYLFLSFKELDSDVASAIVAASAAGFVSVLTIVYSQRRVKEREIAEVHRPHKVKVYGSFMEMTFKALRTVQSSPNRSISPKMVDAMRDFKRDLLIWGSPNVITAYLGWEAQATEKAEKGIVAWDHLLREFRKDLGNSNWGLAEGDLIKVILTKEASDKLFPS